MNLYNFATITTIQFLDISIIPIRPLLPSGSHFPLPSPALATSDLLSVSRVCLFWTFHIDGIIQSVGFCI